MLKLKNCALHQWNHHGYDVAKIFGAKFDMISPVWLQIVLKGKKQYDIAGTHDIKENRKWMKDVQSAGPKKNKSECNCTSSLRPTIELNKFIGFYSCAACRFR